MNSGQTLIKQSTVIGKMSLGCAPFSASFVLRFYLQPFLLFFWGPTQSQSRSQVLVFVF